MASQFRLGLRPRTSTNMFGAIHSTSFGLYAYLFIIALHIHIETKLITEVSSLYTFHEKMLEVGEHIEL